MSSIGPNASQRPERPVLEPIAVVGMACRFPGGTNPDEFWDFLARGGDAVREIPAERETIQCIFV